MPQRPAEFQNCETTSLFLLEAPKVRGQDARSMSGLEASSEDWGWPNLAGHVSNSPRQMPNQSKASADLETRALRVLPFRSSRELAKRA